MLLTPLHGRILLGGDEILDDMPKQSVDVRLDGAAAPLGSGAGDRATRQTRQD
jgi:hypothetical protein